MTQSDFNDIPSLTYEELKPWLNKQDDKTYVVNFWATWCGPCIKELPYFENINKNYKDQNVEVILVSLDFPQMKESRLIPYVKNKNIQSKNQRKFYEQSFTQNELENEVKTILN